MAGCEHACQLNPPPCQGATPCRSLAGRPHPPSHAAAAAPTHRCAEGPWPRRHVCAQHAGLLLGPPGGKHGQGAGHGDPGVHAAGRGCAPGAPSVTPPELPRPSCALRPRPCPPPHPPPTRLPRGLLCALPGGPPHQPPPHAPSPPAEELVAIAEGPKLLSLEQVTPRPRGCHAPDLGRAMRHGPCPAPSDLGLGGDAPGSHALDPGGAMGSSWTLWTLRLVATHLGRPCHRAGVHAV